MNAIMTLVSRMRHGTLLFMVLAMLALAMPARAQPSDPNQPVSPDARSVKEQTLLKEESRIQGRIDIPDTRAAVLIQPAGRTWDYFHEVILHRLGAIVILGMIALLALGYVLLGRLRIESGRSGIKVRRFNGFERFSHWLTAASFVLLGLTGLNITFGKFLLLPVLGADAFSDFAQISKYVHNFVGFSFIVGLSLIVVLWIKDNIPRKVDIEWVKRGGGFIKSKHVSAGRFNAGEKMVFWFVLGAGIAVVASGLLLLFPFYVTNIAGMQIAQVVHAVVAVLFVAVILAHIYIGTLGTEGAFEAMGSGDVDLNWAKEHHDLWLADVLAKGRPAVSPGPLPTAPAE